MFPDSWGGWRDEGFPREGIEKLDLAELGSDWIERRVADTRARYRADDRPGDVLTSYNGKPLTNRDDLTAAMTSVVQGRPRVKITWRRGDLELSDEVPFAPLGAALRDR